MKGIKWNGKLTSLTISEEGCPELYDELSKTVHRERSNRFRTLALIGLFALHQQKISILAGAHPIQIGTELGNIPSSSDSLNDAKNRLKNKFKTTV